MIYPTETCYGMGCSIYDEDSVRRIYEMKERSHGKGMSVIVPDISEWKKIAFVNITALKLSQNFWPGPLTLICKRKQVVPDIVCEKSEVGFWTVACRQSSNEIASALADEYGPIVSTSANLSGGKEPYSVDEIPQRLKDSADLVIDRGRIPRTKPSTIYDCIKMMVVREGPISADEMRKVLGKL